MSTIANSIYSRNVGFQVLVDAFEDESGRQRSGIGLIPGTAARAELAEGVFAGRAVGAVLAGDVSGFEAHHGRVKLDVGAVPLTRVLAGVGNDGDGFEGFVSRQVIATFLHGPLLARNPALADLLLGRIVGTLPPSSPAVWGENWA